MGRLVHWTGTTWVRLVAAAVVLVAAAALAWGFTLDLLDARGTHRAGTPATATVRSVTRVRGAVDTAEVEVLVDGVPVRAEVVLTATDLDPEPGPGDRIDVRHRWVDGELVVVAVDEVFWHRVVVEIVIANLVVLPLAALGLWLAGVRRGPKPAWPSLRSADQG